MSLVVALAGKHEVVLAADTLGWKGDLGGYYTYAAEKIVQIGGLWMLGIAGDSLGSSIFHIANKGSDLGQGEDFYSAAIQLSNETARLYKEAKYTREADLLLAGIYKGEAKVAQWKLNSENLNATSGPDFSGTGDQVYAIGTRYHGGMHFAVRNHRQEMDTRQRILLAYFCVSEVAACDLRVAKPIRVCLVSEKTGVVMLGDDQLAQVEKRSSEVQSTFRNFFVERGPDIPGIE